MAEVVLSSRAEKDLERLPEYLFGKFMYWVRSVEFFGMREMFEVSKHGY